ncbi:fimbrial assembly family protein [Burkholderia sp. S171]|uniref:fimbrial assembly family protein n=1 Tax=Burkholderia sp. S171 TaxID=1641860 RepID=UPI00131E14B1|nr:fimbrial assembly family protein [Burkholderia sp. S171]
MSAMSLHAFNLLPYRSGARRRARNRALALLAGAGLAGCAAVGVVAGWDALERVHIEETRELLDRALKQLSAPIAEHARLVEREALGRRAQSAAVPLAEPRARFLGLLDALARGTSQGNIGLQRVTQRVSEVELAASAPDSHTAAAWLKALEKVTGVRAVEIVEMRQRVVAVRPSAVAVAAQPDAVNSQGKASPYDFIAVVRWTQSAGGDATPKLLKAVRREASSKPKAASRSTR